MNPSSVSMPEVKTIASALSKIQESFVFVGGASLPFYLPPQYVSEARPTNDIDVVLEVLTRIDATRLEKELLRNGFDNEVGYIGRFRYQGIIVDLMSTSEEAFDCKNEWYKDGFDHAIVIEKSPLIKVMSLPYFIACKLEAFHSRGQKDYLNSRDMEDVIGLLDVTSQDQLENILKSSNQNLREYLKKQFQTLQGQEEFKQSVPAHAMNRIDLNEVVRRIFNRMDKLIQICR
jgi:hypothetical protein